MEDQSRILISGVQDLRFTCESHELEKKTNMSTAGIEPVPNKLGWICSHERYHCATGASNLNNMFVVMTL